MNLNTKSYKEIKKTTQIKRKRENIYIFLDKNDSIEP